MDPRLLRAYNDELIYLRESAREFAEENETAASRLGLKAPAEPDPYVERLLEGVAFLGARVSLKLQDQFPDFTQHLLHAIQPQYLSPTPSMCVVAFEPVEGDPALRGGVTLPRLTTLDTTAAAADGAQVTFRTAQAVTLWPLQIVEAEYLPNRASVAAFAGAGGVRAEAGLRLRFRAQGGALLSQIPVSRLPIYLDGSEALPGELYRQIIGDTLSVIARPARGGTGGEGQAVVELPRPAQFGFDDDCALLPAERRSLRGYRLLTEYFACPERFLFVELQGLDRAFAAAGEMCDVVLLFSRGAPALGGVVTSANFRLFATPAINLFEKQLGRVPFDLTRTEHQLMPDRVRPLDFEVFRVLEVTAYGRSNSDPRPVAPLYALGASLHDWSQALFYTPRLRQRRLSTREQRVRKRGDYIGTETWLALTAGDDPSALKGVYELAVRCLVTNRELPELLSFKGVSDFQVEEAAVRSVRVVRPPTRPRPPMGLNDAAWRVIGHLTPNYASLAAFDNADPSILRDHLALYGRIDEAGMRRQIDGVLALGSQPVTRRVRGLDRMAFARGLQVRVRLDDAAFENARMFLFAAVIDRFLAEFVTLNSFTETVFESPQEGVFARWPLRTGRKAEL